MRINMKRGGVIRLKPNCRILRKNKMEKEKDE